MPRGRHASSVLIDSAVGTRPDASISPSLGPSRSGAPPTDCARSPGPHIIRAVITTAVILARGLGTRMRAPAEASTDAEQARVAATGVKALIPVGRPFLDFVLSALADAGVTDAVLVVGPEHGALRDRYERVARPTRLHVRFAIQAEPRGTADAVLAAEAEVAGHPFIVINSDNYYPVEALRQALALDGPGLVAFERAALLAGGLEPARVLRYALLQVAADGTLEGLVEKPSPEVAAAMGEHALVSMTLWAFDHRIFEACRRVAPSIRGELELPEAAMLGVRTLGVPLRVASCALPVLDLSSRADIAPVAERLRGIEVRL